ncbi:hypothetical protein ACFTWS_08345 [Streptomyces sp. NPDC057027]|uniref:hypothetical protein n=1 Tax=Streptomyces sp. NPDC057027 TaxID=3346004 RepID=UPI0036393503
MSSHFETIADLEATADEAGALGGRVGAWLVARDRRAAVPGDGRPGRRHRTHGVLRLAEHRRLTDLPALHDPRLRPAFIAELTEVLGHRTRLLTGRI